MSTRTLIADRVLRSSASGFVIRVPDLDETVTALAPRLIADARARPGCLRTAEDIAQDALVALVRRWRQQGPPDSSEAYVFAIARRRVLRVTIDYRDAAAADVLGALARAAGIPLEIGSGTLRPVTIA